MTSGIKAKFGFLEMQFKLVLRNTFKFGKPMFRKTPKAFNAVNMVALPGRELIVAMVHTEMLFVTKVNETIVATPAICVNHALNVRLASDNCL